MNDTSVRPTKWSRGIRFGTWNVRNLYRSGSLTTVVKELAKFKLDLVGVQEVRWDKGAVKEQGIKFFYEKGKENHQFETGYLTSQNSVSS